MTTRPAETLPRTAYRIREVAASVGVSERTVRRWITSGELPAKRPGGRVIVLAPDLTAFLARLSDAAS